jgi:hypothetical protein
MTETSRTRLPCRPNNAASLAFRIHGGSYSGRLVRIHGRRCTIGSASDCTLRFASPGVRPLHCILLSDESGVNVRRWSPDTLLNGGSFNDALLGPGDRLTLGPIELEMLGDDAWRSTKEALPAAEPVSPVDLIDQIAAQLREEFQPSLPPAPSKRQAQRRLKLLRRIEQLEAELRERTADLDQLKTARDEASLAVLRTELEREDAQRQIAVLQERTNGLDASARQLGAERDGLQQQLSLQQQQTAHLEDRCRKLEQQLQHAQCELSEARAKLDSHESAMVVEGEQAMQSLAAAQARVAQLESQLAEAVAEQARLSQALSELSQQQLFAVPAAPPADRGPELEAWEEQVRQLQANLTSAEALRIELQESAEQSSQEWSRREQELTQQIESLEKLAGKLEEELRAARSEPDQSLAQETQRQAVEQQLTAAQQQWGQQRQELEQQALSAHEQLQDMESQVACLRDSLHSAKAEIRERDELLSQLRDEVRGQVAAWEQERGQLLQQQAAVREDRNESAESNQSFREERAQPEAVFDAHTTESEDNCEEIASAALPSEQAEQEPPNRVESPVDTDPTAEKPVEDWRRLALAACEEPANESVPPSQPTPEPASTAWRPPASGNNDDESIEAYMARLLKRVRGDAVADAFVQQQTPVEPASAPEPVARVEPSDPKPEISSGPDEPFLPRKSAPELATDLAAMRELAVHSARQAINRSSQQRFKKNSLGTTLGACALVGVGIGLFGWGFDTGNPLAWLGCGVCLAAGTFLLLRRVRMKREAKAPIVEIPATPSTVAPQVNA